jgi:hypothetical protein
LGRICSEQLGENTVDERSAPLGGKALGEVNGLRYDDADGGIASPKLMKSKPDYVAIQYWHALDAPPSSRIRDGGVQFSELFLRSGYIASGARREPGYVGGPAGDVGGVQSA